MKQTGAAGNRNSMGNICILAASEQLLPGHPPKDFTTARS
jgi:hypothetical protein